jgi:hypothetical protein
MLSGLVGIVPFSTMVEALRSACSGFTSPSTDTSATTVSFSLEQQMAAQSRQRPIILNTRNVDVMIVGRSGVTVPPRSPQEKNQLCAYVSTARVRSPSCTSNKRRSVEQYGNQVELTICSKNEGESLTGIFHVEFATGSLTTGTVAAVARCMLLVSSVKIDDDLRLISEPIVERNEEACDAGRLGAPSTSHSWIFFHPSHVSWPNLSRNKPAPRTMSTTNAPSTKMDVVECCGTVV